jgi:YARHG domain
MPRKILLLGILLVLATNLFAQDTTAKWSKFDFTKKTVTKNQLKDYGLDELQKIRGIVFGKRGRIFVERSIQDYLSKQSWYKPNKSFDNNMLGVIERKNIDVIREAEANARDSVAPGDLRFWKTKLITEENLYGDYSAADLRIMIAEIEAIHGKRFDEEEWLQKYFEERYWYKANANYSSAILTETERKNLQTLTDKRKDYKKTEISFGDMDKFQTVLLKEEQLKGLNLNELRSIRNEFFARHGKRFTVAAYIQDFEWKDWYKPLKDQSKVKLNEIEEQNIKVIQGYEAKIRERLTTDVLSEDDISGLYAEDLRVLRNEIFAKHGRIFKDAKLQKYFEAQPWYKADATFTNDKIAAVLSETEFKNVSTIKTAEEYAASKFVLVEG